MKAIETKSATSNQKLKDYNVQIIAVYDFNSNEENTIKNFIIDLVSEYSNFEKFSEKFFFKLLVGLERKDIINGSWRKK